MKRLFMAALLAIGAGAAQAQVFGPIYWQEIPSSSACLLQANTATGVITCGTGGGGGISSVTAGDTSVIATTTTGAVTLKANTPLALTFTSGTITITPNGSQPCFISDQSFSAPSSNLARMKITAQFTANNGTFTSGYTALYLLSNTASPQVGYASYWNPSTGSGGIIQCSSGSCSSLASTTITGENASFLQSTELVANGQSYSAIQQLSGYVFSRGTKQGLGTNTQNSSAGVVTSGTWKACVAVGASGTTAMFGSVEVAMDSSF